MALVIGSIWSFSGHQQGAVTMVPGDGVTLPDGALLHLDDFRYERYDDGRPKDWVSVVTITKDGKTIKDKVELRVNTPLRYAGLTFYQVSFEEVPSLVLSDAKGTELVLAQGEERIVDDIPYLFMAPDADGKRAVLRVGSGMEGKTIKALPGETAGTLTVTGLRAQLATGLEAVTDPGFPLVLVALVLIAAGTTWTFAQKLKEGV